MKLHQKYNNEIPPLISKNTYSSYLQEFGQKFFMLSYKYPAIIYIEDKNVYLQQGHKKMDFNILDELLVIPKNKNRVLFYLTKKHIIRTQNYISIIDLQNVKYINKFRYGFQIIYNDDYLEKPFIFRLKMGLKAYFYMLLSELGRYYLFHSISLNNKE